MPRSSSPDRISSARPRGDGGSGPGEGEGGGGGGGGDRLVKVAFAPNQMEAEMIQGLLSDHGIQSMLKRGPGFDVPEFLASGPRQVFVLEGVAEEARRVLEGTPGVSPE
jgi:Putative prokaryotic signal transducing protein